MAFGDATPETTALAWEELDYTEYLFRLRDLLSERMDVILRDPLGPAADAECRRLDRAIEETAMEFVAYAARHRLGGVEDVT
jgi:hypothetical protein